MLVVTSLGVKGCSYSLQTSAVNPVSFVSLLNSARSCGAPPVDNADPPVRKIEGSTVKLTYNCLAGYTLLHDSSDNSTLSSTNYTLSCVNGAFEGQIPVCTSESLSFARCIDMFTEHGQVYIAYP